MLDLGQIDSLSLARRRLLEAAGVPTVEDLARIDVTGLARKTGIPEAPLRDFKHKAAALVMHEAIRGIGQTLRGIGPASIPVLVEVATEGLLQAMAESLRRGVDGLDAIRRPPEHQLPPPPRARDAASPTEGGPITSFDSADSARPVARKAVEAVPLQAA